MSLISPTPPPYDPIEWSQRPFAERARMVCEAWAIQGYGTPPAVFLVYALKVAAYVYGWMFFCRFTPGLGDPSDVARWWLHPVAFQKAIIWSMLFEVLGFGCGSGPLTGRYFPPFGGFLYFLRPGTTKLPPFPGLPFFGRPKRNEIDVLLYFALLAFTVRALMAPAPALAELLPIVILVPLLGLVDQTIFLAARAEHYWVTCVCFAFAGNLISGAKAVQLALWFWAGFSKLNHHFPTVVCVMTSNGPLTRFPWLRRMMYRGYPHDLRPSRLATWMAHGGTALEVGVPLAFVLTPSGVAPLTAVVLMLMLHAYITSSVPMGVPIEWNVMVVYAGFALFWAHPDVSPFAVDPPWLAMFLATTLILVPLAGNLWPRRISFLLAMRYYAGNWPFSIWLFRGTSFRRLALLKKASPWVYDQLEMFYPRSLAVAVVGKVMGFRLMHLHGRLLASLLPRAVERLEEYEWLDGEIVAGMALGWNFGDGHLHQEQLLASIQAQCGFEEGELRCIFAESQPMGKSTIEWRVVDAKAGQLAAGEMPVGEMLCRQPWLTA